MPSMAPIATWWAGIVHVFNFLTFSSRNANLITHRPALQIPVRPHHLDHPIFEPPNGPESDVFTCEYPAMKGFEPCSTHDNRGCWLKSAYKEFNIHTDYEVEHPVGIKRKYYLETSDMALWPDGCEMAQGKVFNRSYPGPWIQACWGDEVEITVKNHLKCNGTTVHWHGIRQLGSVEMDGVNGVTQCPIAPGHSFTYTFKALQYGSSWYHSHYSLQVGGSRLMINYTQSKALHLVRRWFGGYLDHIRTIFSKLRCC